MNWPAKSKPVADGRKPLKWIEAAARQYGMPLEQLIAQYKSPDILKTSLTLKQVGETAAFLASETGVAFNSHIVDVDCGKLNIL